MHAQAQLRDRPEPGEAAPPARRQDWTAIAEAAAILADCAARPPAMRLTEIVDLSTCHVPLYVGRRVGRLNAIHRAEARRILALCDAARDYGAFDAHVRRSVQNAIADTLLHAALARSAACDARMLEMASCRKRVLTQKGMQEGGMDGVSRFRQELLNPAAPQSQSFQPPPCGAIANGHSITAAPRSNRIAR